MYTKGIRKILIVDNCFYGIIDKLFEMAENTKHNAVCHNDQIYIKVGKSWEKSPFEITDFEITDYN